MKSSSVETDDNPCIRKQSVVLLKQFDVLIARLRHVNERVPVRIVCRLDDLRVMATEIGTVFMADRGCLIDTCEKVI